MAYPKDHAALRADEQRIRQYLTDRLDWSWRPQVTVRVGRGKVHVKVVGEGKISPLPWESKDSQDD
jgi:hypothetical protein